MTRDKRTSRYIRENGRHPLGALLDRDDPDLKEYRRHVREDIGGDEAEEL